MFDFNFGQGLAKTCFLMVICVNAVTGAAAAQTLTVLHTFTDTPDGAYSSAGLTPDGRGNLYGTTQAGGANRFDGGTVFKIDRRGKETVLYSFCADENCTDGTQPLGGVIFDLAGNVYGTTSLGGAFGFGTVFKLDPSGKETVLYSFKGLNVGDGAAPGYGNLLRDQAGNLYGVTLNGGLNCTYSSLGCGTIFKVDPSGKETVIHRFSGGLDGALPPSNLTADSQGRLYGTTLWGGSENCGTVFAFSRTKRRVLHNFSCAGEFFPNAGLARDSQGSLYGTTAFGGDFSFGTVFKLTPDGHESVLYSFKGGAGDGCVPSLNNLILDKDDNLYGITADCGANQAGVVFKLDRAGNETILYNFTGQADGGNPQTTLVRDARGNLYGTTYFGAACCGTVFKLTP